MFAARTVDWLTNSRAVAVSGAAFTIEEPTTVALVSMPFSLRGRRDHGDGELLVVVQELSGQALGRRIGSLSTEAWR